MLRCLLYSVTAPAGRQNYKHGDFLPRFKHFGREHWGRDWLQQQRSAYIDAYCKKQKVDLFACPSCAYNTNSRGNLYRHKRSVHQKKKEECPMCGKTYASAYDLRTHVRVVHGENPFFVTSTPWDPQLRCAICLTTTNELLNDMNWTLCNSEYCDKFFHVLVCLKSACIVPNVCNTNCVNVYKMQILYLF